LINFFDVIGKCSSSAKAIEYETNGQWKAVGEEKPSRRAQREREAYKAAQQAIKTSNGKSAADIDQSPDDDFDDERLRTKSTERSTVHDDIPVIELDDD